MILRDKNSVLTLCVIQVAVFFFYGQDSECKPLFSSQLSPNKAPENSGRGTLVGSLSTSDPDRGQTFMYTLLDNAGGRFMLDKNSIKVTEHILSGTILSMTKCAAGIPKLRLIYTLYGPLDGLPIDGDR